MTGVGLWSDSGFGLSHEYRGHMEPSLRSGCFKQISSPLLKKIREATRPSAASLRLKIHDLARHPLKFKLPQRLRQYAHLFVTLAGAAEHAA